MYAISHLSIDHNIEMKQTNKYISINILSDKAVQTYEPSTINLDQTTSHYQHILNSKQ